MVSGPDRSAPHPLAAKPQIFRTLFAPEERFQFGKIEVTN